MKTINLIILIVLVLASSCDFCHEKEMGRLDLTEAQKQLIPYEKGNIYSFIDTQGQSIDFAVTESNLRWGRNDIQPGGMCSDYVMTGSKYVALKSISGNFKIDLGMAIPGYVLGKSFCGFTVGIWPDYSGWNKIVRFRLRSDTEGKFLIDTVATLFHESIEINNKVYYNVVEENHEIEAVYGQPGSPMESVQLFYNQTYGILQVNIAGKNFLTINH